MSPGKGTLLSSAPPRLCGEWRLSLPSLLLFLAVAGCAPREVFVRPAGGQGQAVESAPFVGVRQRVPPQAAEARAWTVAALAPLVRSREDDDRAVAVALIEFRNKSDGPIVFLPAALELAPADGEAWRPVETRRGNRAVGEEETVAPWSEATFTARFEAGAGALEGRAWTLRWAYRCAGRDYGQATRFEAAGRRPGSFDSAASSAPGLDEGSYCERSSGVPLLMDIPFLGGLFRSGSRSAASAGTELGPAASEGTARTWWEMEGS